MCSSDLGTIKINTDGSYTYMPDPNNPDVQGLGGGETLTDTFTYTISDGHGGTATTTVTITINGANDAPVARPDTNLAVRGQPDASGHNDNNPNTTIVAGNVIPNDSDPEGDTLTIVGVVPGTQPSASGNVGAGVLGTYGTIVVNPNGTYTYALNNTNPAVQALTGTNTLTDTFTYTISDGKGGTATTTVTITIGATANTPPTAVPDTNTATEDGPAVTGNVINPQSPGDRADNDLDNDPLTVVGVAKGDTGTATGNVGTNVTGET